VPGKEAFERKLEALTALRSSPQEAVDALRKTLKDRSNYLVSKAAALVGELRLTELIPDLLQAFDRFILDAAKTDPQCWAKNAIVKALKDLDHDDPAVFLRGLEHVQMEPVWGGSADAAVALRGACALALAGCALDRQTILTRLTGLLVDEPPIRRDAIRALGQFPGPDTVLLLRLKALLPEKDPAVTGQCFDALLDISPVDSIPFVAQFLSSQDPDLQSEAVGALAASRQPAAAEMLIPVIERDRPELAAVAVACLAHSRFREELRERIGAIVRRRDTASLTEAYRKEFDPLLS
jgi:HEAT repeat protein